MGFPVDGLVAAVAVRDATWALLGLAWRFRPGAPGRGSSAVVGEFESPAWLGNVLVWASGEAELDAIRLADDQAFSKHYDMTGRAGLDGLLGELTALLAAGHVPDAAVVHRYPGQ